ncbi:MAG: GntR family transcriptional regulator [Aestuariivirgaceae bacterium]
MTSWNRTLLDLAEFQESSPNRPDEEAIVERIFEAVIEQRLPPGTKLSESALCEAFGVGRMRIRRSLLLLASREIVELHSNRGAYVSSPTPDQAREVFEARRSIEPNVARIAVERANDADIEAMRQHLAQEGVAHHQGDRREAIRLSGLFHVKLARIAGNAIMARMVKELVTRTSLIIGMFGAPGTTNCAENEHHQILQAFKTKDQDEVARLMRAHLEHIEAETDLNAGSSRNVDLVKLFKNS